MCGSDLKVVWINVYTRRPCKLYDIHIELYAVTDWCPVSGSSFDAFSKLHIHFWPRDISLLVRNKQATAFPRGKVEGHAVALQMSAIQGSQAYSYRETVPI